MQNILLAILIVMLIPIVIEDFRFRRISLVWLIGIFITATILQINSGLAFLTITKNVVLNLSIIAVNYLVLTIYFSFKNKRLINIQNQYLGIGDTIFIVSLSFLFSPLNFVCFLVFSLFFTLLFTLFVRLASPEKFKTIPLAGLQALLLFFIITTLFGKSKIWEINSDEFTLNILLKYIGLG